VFNAVPLDHFASATFPLLLRSVPNDYCSLRRGDDPLSVYAFVLPLLEMLKKGHVASTLSFQCSSAFR